MGLFSHNLQPFPKWIRFPNGASYAEAERLGLGPGDGISVRLAGREVPMDLTVTHLEGFVVQDPDGSSHLHDWNDALSYWKRIK